MKNLQRRCTTAWKKLGDIPDELKIEFGEILRQALGRPESPPPAESVTFTILLWVMKVMGIGSAGVRMPQWIDLWVQFLGCAGAIVSAVTLKYSKWVTTSLFFESDGSPGVVDHNGM